MIAVYTEITSGGIGFSKSMYDAYNLMYMINKNCLFEDIVHDVITFCVKNNKSCGYAGISQNVLSNFFKITAAANDLAEAFKEQKPSD